MMQQDARRPTSLLIAFAAIHGFYRHALRAQDVELAEGLQEYYELVHAQVTAVGGTVVKYMGDSALVVFAETAVDLGATCLLELKARGDAWLQQYEWSGCRLNIKAHFGEVIAGPFGPVGQQHFDVIGRAVNATARLESPGVAISVQAFRKLSAATRREFKKHTPPVTYIRQADRH